MSKTFERPIERFKPHSCHLHSYSEVLVRYSIGFIVELGVQNSITHTVFQPFSSNNNGVFILFILILTTC